MAKSAYADEVRQCLSPPSNDSEQHLARIKLIKTAIKTKASPTRETEKTMTSKFGPATPQQDLEIASIALKFQHEKLANYEMMHPIAFALQLEPVASLVEQTIADHKNTNAWLHQIVQNIIVPELLNLEDTKGA